MLDSLRNNISNENRVLKYESEILYLHYFFFPYSSRVSWTLLIELLGFPRLWICLV